MIQFMCRGCNHRYTVRDEYAGKKVRCKKCGTFVKLPVRHHVSERQIEDTATYVSHEPHMGAQVKDDHTCYINEQSVERAHLPVWALCLFSIMGLAFVTFLVYMLAFRDTWEIDNYAVITGLYMEGANLIAVEEFTEGLAKHHEIIVFVGDRNLKNNHLKEIYRRVRDDYETTKLRWESIYRPLLPKYAEAQLLITSFKYDEAITFCNSIIDGYSPHKDDRFVAKRLNALNELKEQADKEWEKAIDDERSELLPKLLALKEEADKFIDADKWDMALTRLQSIVNAKPPRMWTDEVRTTLDYANAKIGAYRYSKIRRESARYQAITPSYRRTEEEVKRRATQVMPPGRMFARNMADSVVNNITSKSAAFRSAVFTGTTDKGRGEISYNYNVEYLTGGGFVRVGKFNVAIVNGQCREVYFNGGELWVQMIDPALQGYRDPK